MTERRYGVVLAGGVGRRMGRPKHLLEVDGTALVDRVRAVLRDSCERVVVAGTRETEGAALADPADLDGPIAGIVAAHRWAPTATLIVAACDLPGLTRAAVRWLVGRRRRGIWAVLPTVERRPQPLLAVYEPRIGDELERLGRAGRGPSELAAHERVLTPEVPGELAAAWTDVDTPEALAAWRQKHRGEG